MRTLCYVFAATVMIAVAAGMGKVDGPTEPAPNIAVAQAVNR